MTERARLPERVSGENYTDVLRMLDETAPGPASRPIRDATARYLAGRGIDRIESGDLDGAVRALQQALVHYTPEELGRGGLPAELGPLARGVLELVSPRGDEARALAANRILAAITPPDAEAMHRYDAIHEWGDHNRHEFQPPWVYHGEMASVYREVARIVPTPDVLQRVSEMLVERHRAAVEFRAAGAQPGRHLTFEDMQQLQGGLRNTATDLALVYLRLGDLQAAADHVSRLSEGTESQLATALRAIAAGEGGPEGLAELAARLGEVDPGAAAGICRLGRRQHPHDVRFAKCLAIAAVHEGNLGLASAHLEAAAALAPTDNVTLRLAIAGSVEWLESELANDDPAPGRRAFLRSKALLDLWQTRFPQDNPEVTNSQLEDFGAQLELGQANLQAAQEHLERATQARPPARDAFLTLAEIALRKNDPRHAIELLEQGLAVPVQPSESDSTFRPTFELRLGLAARAAGDEALARRHLTAAVTALDALARSLNGPQKANAMFLYAVALDALGQVDQVRQNLDAAINGSPESRDLAGRAITFLLARGRWRDAAEIDIAARPRLALDRTWQVYFAMWGVISSRLAGLEDDGGAAEALATAARGAGDHAPWTVRLAQRYHGDITREQLMQYAAQSTGHRAEAQFYEGMLELVANDMTAAERDLRAVVQSDMLRYFEYEMAWEMLARGLPALRASNPAASTAGTANGPTGAQANATVVASDAAGAAHTTETPAATHAPHATGGGRAHPALAHPAAVHPAAGNRPRPAR